MRIKIISLFLAILTVASLSACTKNTADENKVTDAVTEAVTNNSMKPTSGTFGSFDYITDESVENFQPMGANMGLLPPLPTKIRHKDERYLAVAERAVAALEAIL